MNYLLFRAVVISAILLVLNTGAYAQPPAVRMQVYGTHEGSNIVYHYKVINNSTETLQQFVLGSTYDANDQEEYPQLERLPLGWKYGETGETGTEILLPPGSISHPPYWVYNLYGQQESCCYYVEWETTPDGQAYAIPPGQSLAGFSVTVPMFDTNESPPEYYNAGQASGQDDDMYLTSNFKVSYWDFKKSGLQNVWGKLEIADTTPPTLSVKLTPSRIWPPNDKMIGITATITASDNIDPNPEINLISVTANEPLDKDDVKAKFLTDDRNFQVKAERGGGKAGRIYTVTYRAIDGSGNITLATATVTVPHDREDGENRGGGK